MRIAHGRGVRRIFWPTSRLSRSQTRRRKPAADAFTCFSRLRVSDILSLNSGSKIGGLSSAGRGRGVSVHACREPIHRFVFSNSQDRSRWAAIHDTPRWLAARQAGASRPGRWGFGTEEIRGLFLKESAFASSTSGYEISGQRVGVAKPAPKLPFLLPRRDPR